MNLTRSGDRNSRPFSTAQSSDTRFRHSFGPTREYVPGPVSGEPASIRAEVGDEVLNDIADDFLSLLGTSAAVYERDGRYALGICASGWCKLLDGASRNLCETDDDLEAARSGTWLCHESCWTDASSGSIERGEPVDVECHGGLRIYAVPIKCGEEIVGSINFGYGDPPNDPAALERIAERYHVDPEDLRQAAERYKSRPPYIIEFAKHRLSTSARLIGSILERRQSEAALKRQADELEIRVKELNCLYSFAQIVSRAGITLDEIIAELCELLPASMRRPETVRARIVLEDRVFESDDFSEGKTVYARKVRRRGATIGTIEAHAIASDAVDGDTAEFSEGERRLVNMVAERLGHIAERYSLLAEVEEHRREYENQLDRMGALGGPSPTPLSAAFYGLAPLSESIPHRFHEMLAGFENLLDRALEERAFKTERTLPDELRAFAEELAFLRAGPRDVVDFLTAAVKEKTRDTPQAKSRAILDEGRFMAFEIMGVLVSIYRHHALVFGPAMSVDELDRPRDTHDE